MRRLLAKRFIGAKIIATQAVFSRKWLVLRRKKTSWHIGLRENIKK
jgi:hypothetical protein